MNNSTRFNFRGSLLALAIAAISASAVYAAAPANYYRSCTGKSGAALKTALHELIFPHDEVSSYNNLPNYFRKTDVYPVGDSRYGQWWDMYSDIVLYTRSFSGLNREHSLPKSWWGGSTTTPAYVDLFHLYPSEMAANMAKSNYPLGEVATPTFNNSVSKVGYAVTGQGGGAKEVFEPANEYKGDFARTYFYMVTCYQGELQWKYTYMFSNNTYPTLNSWTTQLLMKWHREDPVSEKERSRQEEVYKVQSNRNPFIDYPELAEYLWGNKQNTPWIPGTTESTGTPVMNTPVNGVDLEFGEVAIGDSETSVVRFQGENITTPITLSLLTYGKKSDPDYADQQRWVKMFSIDTKTLQPSSINAAGGTSVRVTYTPTEEGNHLARLNIEGMPDESSRLVVLRGTGCPVPTLSKLEALDATDITESGYTAHWAVAPLSEAVDYYVLTRTRYVGSQTEEEKMEVEAYDNASTADYTITDATPSSQETYYVQSSRLGHLSEPSNIITVDLKSAGITDVENDNPLGWIAFSGGVRLICGQPHTGVKVYDATGRMVRYIGEIENNTLIELPYGAYFIITDQQHTPARILVQP